MRFLQKFSLDKPFYFDRLVDILEFINYLQTFAELFFFFTNRSIESKKVREKIVPLIQRCSIIFSKVLQLLRS